MMEAVAMKRMILFVLLSLVGCQVSPEPPEETPPAVPENIEENPKLSISQPARTAQPTHRIVFDTEYYTTGPQQSRAPDGTFKAGVEVTLISEAGSYVIVEDLDGLVGHVSRDAVQPLSEPK